MSEFYLICPIGTQDIVKKEIEMKWNLHFEGSLPPISTTPGGVLLETETEKGLALNYILKTPGRILLRVKKQKCRDLPKLFNIIKKIPWKNFLRHTNIEVHITAKKSRLIHSTKIEKTAIDALDAYFTANAISKKMMIQGPSIQNLYLRFFEDELTISLDTSGDLLHIRGDRAFRGHASIRENFAAILLLNLLEDKSYRGKKLIDPMCGTGTFLFEAINFFNINKRVDFPFLTWSENIIKNMPILEDKKSIWDFEEYIGSDIDQKIINSNKDYKSDIQFIEQDLFQSENLPKESLFILNPPYGKRVKIEGDKSIFFQNLIKVFKKHPVGLIVPYPYAKNITGKKLNFKQNGIDVAFIIIS